MLGTTWKKKSRQGLPEERNVPDPFSVKPMGGGVGVAMVVLLKLATIRFMNGSLMAAAGSDCFDCCCGFEFRSSGGPNRAILINLGIGLEGFALGRYEVSLGRNEKRRVEMKYNRSLLYHQVEDVIVYLFIYLFLLGREDVGFYSFRIRIMIAL